MRDYSELTTIDIIDILEAFESDKALVDFVIRRLDLIVWDVLNGNISHHTKTIAKSIVFTWKERAPDLVHAVAEWNLDYPPDETLFALIDELIEPVVISNTNGQGRYSIGIERIATAIIIRAFQDVRDRKLERHTRTEAKEWLGTTGLQWSEMLGVSGENWQKLIESTTGFFI